MNLLIDSQSLIRYVDEDQQLSAIAHRHITAAGNHLFISAATVWEIGIKVGLNKLVLTRPYRLWMERAIANLGLTILAITVEAVERQAGLPWHHRDPLDRLNIAQSLVENTSVISNVPAFDQYGILRLWGLV